MRLMWGTARHPPPPPRQTQLEMRALTGQAPGRAGTAPPLSVEQDYLLAPPAPIQGDLGRARGQLDQKLLRK